MAYQKPGVEIKQIQGSATPILNPADLNSVIVGPGYYVQALTEALDASGDPLIYDGAANLAVDLINTNADFKDVSRADRTAYLPIVDLIGVAGPNAGEVYHCVDADMT